MKRRSRKRAGGNSGGGIELDQAIVQASATLLAVVVGGLISARTADYFETQRRKDEEKKRLEERLGQDILRRNDAYIKFLSLTPATACEINKETDLPKLGFVRNVGLESASVLAYGSVKVATKLAQSYPLREWSNVVAIQDSIVEELRDERLSVSRAEAGSVDTLGSLAKEEAKAKSWWQFWRK